MDNNEAQQVQAPLPQPARAPRRREVAHEDVFKAYEFIDNFSTQRSGLPLPKKAPKIEATVYPFDKNKDATGSDQGDLFKRGVFQVQDHIGDKRREVLHILPANKKNAKQLKQLENELNGLNEKLLKKIAEMEMATNIVLRAPYHFKDFPKLED